VSDVSAYETDLSLGKTYNRNFMHEP